MEQTNKNNSSETHNSEIIKLNVGGEKYTTTRSTLTSGGKDSFFARMLDNNDGGRIKSETDEEGYIFVDRNGKTFEDVLDYLRNGEILTETGTKRCKVEREIDFYGIGTEKEKGDDASRPGEMFFSTCKELRAKVAKELDRNKEAIEKSIQKSVDDGKAFWALRMGGNVDCWTAEIPTSKFEIKIDPFNYMGGIIIMQEIENRWGCKGQKDKFSGLLFDLTRFLRAK